MIGTNYPPILQRWFSDLWTDGNMAALDGLVTVDFVAHAPHDFTIRLTRHDYQRMLQWYHHTFADPQWQIDDVIVAGNSMVVRCTGWATYRGGWLDIPSTEQRTRECCIMIFRLAGGRIQELWFEVSDLDVIHQLGARVTVDDQAHPKQPLP